jgi:hypothetical protein
MRKLSEPVPSLRTTEKIITPDAPKLILDSSRKNNLNKESGIFTLIAVQLQVTILHFDVQLSGKDWSLLSKKVNSNVWKMNSLLLSKTYLTV